jgi:hypothetical protein
LPASASKLSAQWENAAKRAPLMLRLTERITQLVSLETRNFYH